MQSLPITEYNKLDGIDKKVLSWTIKNSPASIPSWIEHTVRSYRNLKGIKINEATLLDEVKSNLLKTSYKAENLVETV